MDASLLYLPSAIGLGALHALEPGHAKTLTAAYLIGTKGTKRDAILLGLAVAFTHSIVVILLAALGVWLGKEAFTDRAMYWLQIGSSVIVILLGCYLMYRRWPRKMAAHPHDHEHHHHHAPQPFLFAGQSGAGNITIIDTPEGERFKLHYTSGIKATAATIRIMRPHDVVEELPLTQQADGSWLSDKAPEEPHSFDALLEIQKDNQREEIPFQMAEPEEHHHHDHDHGHHHEHGLDQDEEAHARAHAATLPEYVRRGERPTPGQILAFGAAGGMIPCPAAVTVMLLAVSINRAGTGLLMVLGFSIGLALALVGIGLAVVMGLSALGSTGRFAWFSRKAPLISSGVVVLSGAAALVVSLASPYAH